MILVINKKIISLNFLKEYFCSDSKDISKLMIVVGKLKEKCLKSKQSKTGIEPRSS